MRRADDDEECCCSHGSWKTNFGFMYVCGMLGGFECGGSIQCCQEGDRDGSFLTLSQNWIQNHVDVHTKNLFEVQAQKADEEDRPDGFPEDVDRHGNEQIDMEAMIVIRNFERDMQSPGSCRGD